MESNIQDEIKKMPYIELKYEDFIGKGSFAQVYSYKIGNTQLAVKCFEKEEKAKEENDILK